MTKRVIAWDTETALIRQGVRAPELTCLTYSVDGWALESHPSEWPAKLHTRTEAITLLREWLRDPATHFVGQNIAFDWGVVCAEAPDLIPLVFAAYDSQRVTDTKLRQQILDIAAGCYRGEFKGHRFVKYDYSLDALSRRLLGWQLDKDTWRLRYGELRDVPLAEWPEGARTYPLDDARATLAVYLAQEKHAEYLGAQYRLARRAWNLSLMEAWGLRTYPEGVERFAGEVRERLTEVHAELVTLGLARANGSRDTKAAARIMIEACNAKGLYVSLTDAGEKRAQSGADASDVASFNGAFTDGTGVSLDADACKRVEDPRLELYAEFSTLKAVESKDLPMLSGGVTYPIHTRFDLADTERTTSSAPNIQNIRSLPGIRECFVPRLGWVYAQADYPGLELKTLAQSCIDLLGSSTLAAAINSGVDPHLQLAASIAGTSLDDATARHHAGDKEIKQARKLAKVANFGFPGGLGIATFLQFARGKPYNLAMTEDEARRLKALWLSTWPEMREYFARASELCESEVGATLVECPRTKWLRGKVRYTALCNGYFQNLGAVATAEALALISRACYVDTNSPLYGCRPVNYIHDEFILEVRDDASASPAVLELCRLMVEGANRWLPDVPFTEVDPVLMSHWSKDAESLRDESGGVLVWRGKAES